MAEEDEDPRLTSRLDSILERLRRLELQMNGIIASTTVRAQRFVVLDEAGGPRARVEMAGHSPQIVLLDRAGKERLRIGLHTDGTPSRWVEGHEVPFVIPENRG